VIAPPLLALLLKTREAEPDAATSQSG
jgi:hypothetical protein